MADVRSHIMQDFFLQELKNNLVQWQEGRAKYEDGVLNECIDNDREKYNQGKKKARGKGLLMSPGIQNISLSSLEENELNGDSSKEESKEGKFNYTRLISEQE